MASWRRALALMAYNVEAQFDALKFRLRRRLGALNAVMILAYRGYGTAQTFHIKGRVIENRGVLAASDNDSIWRNLLNTYRRFASDEIPGAVVRARFGGVTHQTTSDRAGYFEFHFAPDPALLRPDQTWYDVTLDLLDYPGPRQADTTVTASVLVPAPGAEFAVVSDLDDTVIQSDVINLLKLARNTFLKNARTRLPFAGVAAFYHALQTGRGGGPNPIFYVSSSPWNLYDLMDDFFEIRGIPAGPLFLADLGISRQQFLKPDRRRHKLEKIERIMQTYPALPFVLVGDSGELDPEIYLQVVLDNPGRVRAVYIRDVSRAARDAYIQSVAARVKAAGSEMLLVKDTLAAAQHAVHAGLIAPEAIGAIRRESAEDRQPPTPVEQVLDEESLA